MICFFVLPVEITVRDEPRPNSHGSVTPIGKKYPLVPDHLSFFGFHPELEDASTLLPV